MGCSIRRPVVIDAGDRLSLLPDDILHTIMSFLPVWQAVQTCVLSRRWERLWCSMPCLNIDQQEFEACGRDREGGRFEEYVNNLLMFHSAPSLDMFKFHVTHNYDYKVVDRWIRRGIKCCPAVVEIYNSSNTQMYELTNLGSSACRLKKLHLVVIALVKGFTQHLPSACPVLEDLELDKCCLDHPKIVSFSLKNLILTDCTTYGKVLTITTPALVSFHLDITADGSDDIIANEMPSLVKASLCLRYPPRTGRSLPEGPCKILRNLSNLRNLELSGSKTLSVLHEVLDTFPTFSNLRTLLFDGCDLSDDFQILGCFLNNAPSLEKLTLQYCKLPEGSRKRKRTDNPKRITIKCQDKLTLRCPNLKLTEIMYREEDVHQLFGLLSGIWRNLRKTTIVLTKA
uniref:F-box domain-containing protein n=1 Tax=Oryza punctata TaxID=4537 RepID=A0A0E0K6P5_ORYPU